MATSVAHGLIGISTYCAMASVLPARYRLPVDYKALLLAAVAANIPDLDMLVSLVFFSDHKMLHGGLTHSIAFAGLVALLLWLVGRGRTAPVIALTGFFLVLSHVLVDWLTGPQWGWHPSHGVPLFWPFSEAMVNAPVTLFKGVIHDDLLPGALYTALWELLFLGPPAFGLMILAFKIQTNKQLLQEEVPDDRVKAYR